MAVINTNISALLANQALGRANRTLASATTSLSTGLRINSAKDDAAGLSIANTMTAQINGLMQAVRNASDGISLVQVADAAISDIVNQLVRARTLAVQLGNDTLTSTDRESVFSEIEQAIFGAAQIVANTEFNTQPLLRSDSLPTDTLSVRQVNTQISAATASSSIAIASASNVLNTQTNIREVRDSINSYIVRPSVSTSGFTAPSSTINTTVAEMGPTWSADGQELLFASGRSGSDAIYSMPANGGVASVATLSDVTSQRFYAGGDRFRLTDGGTSVALDWKDSNGVWRTLASYPLFQQTWGGLKNFSFSPTDSATSVSFVYTDTKGNFQEVSVNRETRARTSQSLISTNDTLNITADQLDLGSAPNLVNMNTPDALFLVEKVNDAGTRQLTYWDGTGSSPAGGYYTISGTTIQFFGDARIGAEVSDDAQDYYQFTRSIDSNIGANFYSVDVPTGAELYNMDGSAGPVH